MNKEQIKQVFDNVQEQLDTLQGSGASFMFIGTEGNHFVCSGRPLDIATQIVFSMIRYPVIRDIIKLSADQYDGVSAQCRENVKQTKMDHLIEQNSGN